MKKVLIISMSRMGDLVQTFPVIRALKEDNNVHVSVLARKTFSSIANNFNYIDELIIFDTNIIIGKFTSSGIKDYRIALGEFIDELKAKSFDEVINLTFSRVSALIAYLIDAPVKRGYNLSENGTFFFDGLWSQYFNGAILNRTVNSINIVDVFKNISGVKKVYKNPVFDRNILDTERLLGNIVDRGDYVFAFQLGSSSENKRWPVKSFVGLAKLIIRDEIFSNLKLKFILIGSVSEIALSEEFLDSFRSNDGSSFKIINMVGKTTVDEISMILSRVDMLITNDTGPMHIAALHEVPMVNISLGPVNFKESGPYSSRVIILAPKIECSPCNFEHKCSHTRCKMYVKPVDALEAVKIIDNFQMSENKSEITVGKSISGFANFYFSKIVYDNRLPRSLEYIPLNRQPLTFKILSELICNFSINNNLEFSHEYISVILKRIDKYDSSRFDFKTYRKSFDFMAIKKLISRSKNILNKIENEHDEMRLKFLKEELLENDVNIIKFQEKNEILKFLFGLFQSFKASNTYSNKPSVKIDSKIYEHLDKSLYNIRIILFKVGMQLSQKIDINYSLSMKSLEVEAK